MKIGGTILRVKFIKIAQTDGKPHRSSKYVISKQKVKKGKVIMAGGGGETERPISYLSKILKEDYDIEFWENPN